MNGDKLPAADELEISLFGPGYGESVVLHAGASEWAILDSCQNSTKDVAPLAYLRSLGIDPASAVRVVVATHWHDDHARGLAEVVTTCTSAEFVCASALTKQEFVAMVTRYEQRNQISSSSGVREIFGVLKNLIESGRRPTYAIANRPVCRFTNAEALLRTTCTMTALSPSDEQVELFWSEIAALMPDIRQTKRRAVAQGPNHVAVVIWLNVGNQLCVLLGSDLEETNEPRTGWSVIVDSSLSPQGTAAIFKVPHHGSDTGQSDGVWREMVGTDAYSILTPFTRGSVQLPTERGVRCILDRTKEAYSTSRLRSRSVARRNPAVERTIRETVGTLRTVEPRFGHVRLRKKYEPGSSWSVELFGNACKLQDIFL
jgi:beta-lactamase superfamily II metal-dependent hydrolase